uniref:Uncharacterized protein n=1 Tax=Moniliophthora roreri TaxID=221103 RepID=A0A0W0F536_MONRR
MTFWVGTKAPFESPPGITFTVSMVVFGDSKLRRIFLHGYWTRDGSVSWALHLKEEPKLLDAHLPGYRLKERNAQHVDRLVPSFNNEDIVKGKVWDCESWKDLLLFEFKVQHGFRVKLEPVEIIINNSASPTQAYAFIWDNDWVDPGRDPVKPEDTVAAVPEIGGSLVKQEKTLPFFFHDSILQDVFNHLGPLKLPSRVAYIVEYKPTTFGPRCGLSKVPNFERPPCRYQSPVERQSM